MDERADEEFAEEPVGDVTDEVAEDLSTEWGVRTEDGQIVLSGIGSREPAEAAAKKVHGVAVYRIISRWREAPVYVRRRFNARRK